MRTRKFRQLRLLIVGCGQTGQAIARDWSGKARIRALTSTPDNINKLRRLGITPILGDLDKKISLNRVSRTATHVFMLAPPPQQGLVDSRSLNMIRALRRQKYARRIVYASTSGVYGDMRGAVVTETSALNAKQPRSLRRIDAERRWRNVTRSQVRGGIPPWHTSIIRIAGIYHANNLPLERIRAQIPVLKDTDDVYTNHIGLTDLAHACIKVWLKGGAQRVYNISDGHALKHADYIYQVADYLGLPRPPKVSATELQTLVTPMQWSFLSESRQVNAQRLMTEIKPMLITPDLSSALNDWLSTNIEG